MDHPFLRMDEFEKSSQTPTCHQATLGRSKNELLLLLAEEQYWRQCETKERIRLKNSLRQTRLTLEETQSQYALNEESVTINTDISGNRLHKTCLRIETQLETHLKVLQRFCKENVPNLDAVGYPYNRPMFNITNKA